MKNSSSSDSAGFFIDDDEDPLPEVALVFIARDSISPDIVDWKWLDGVVSLLQEDEKEEWSVKKIYATVIANSVFMNERERERERRREELNSQTETIH